MVIRGRDELETAESRGPIDQRLLRKPFQPSVLQHRLVIFMCSGLNSEDLHRDRLLLLQLRPRMLITHLTQLPPNRTSNVALMFGMFQLLCQCQ
jgi:hypothetical protein